MSGESKARKGMFTYVGIIFAIALAIGAIYAVFLALGEPNSSQPSPHSIQQN